MLIKIFLNACQYVYARFLNTFLTAVVSLGIDVSFVHIVPF